MKVGDIIWFQAYKRNPPVQGRIVKIGTSVELGTGFDETDDRIFYTLESIEERPFIFTRTTRQWLFTEKPTHLSPYEIYDDETGKIINIMGYNLEDAIRISESIDYNEHKNYSIIDTYGDIE